MGLLKAGQPLSWKDTLPHCQYVRAHGVIQFLHNHKRGRNIENDRLFYGDEIEYALLKLDPSKREVRISLRGVQVMEELAGKEKTTDSRGGQGCAWHQEYGSWMLEGTPAAPFGGYTNSLLQVERSMRLRRARLQTALAPDEIAPTVVCFPLMGVGDFVHPSARPGGPASLSDSVPDACINPHPRFGTLTANIRSRRGSKVDIKVPVFKDTATEATLEHIEMDCMAYGMGCCCLQVTFQGSDLDESRFLYDQLAPLAPIMMALTAATPILNGRLADTDARWKVISASVDDRTPPERGEAGASTRPDPRQAGDGVARLSKSRYDSISAYISKSANATDALSAHYNDVACEVDAEIQAKLRENGIDEPLGRHIAHLFVRDPLVAFEGAIAEVDDSSSVEHFESLNSTNWQSMRWKPPPVQKQCAPHVGWRTEFRSMEVQLSDFENAAFTAFVVLLTRVLLVFDLDFLVPLSKVDENMDRAHVVNAVEKSKFWFRNDVLAHDDNDTLPSVPDETSYSEMSMADIMCGKGCFPGLVPLCYAYLEHIECDPQSFDRIDQYLTFIKRRATGELLTPATWMRKFVRTHPEYKKDSVVTQGIAFDLMRKCNEIGLGEVACPDLLGDVVVEPIKDIQAYQTHLLNKHSGQARSKLLEKLHNRCLQEDGPGSRPSRPLRKRQRSYDQIFGS